MGQATLNRVLEAFRLSWRLRRPFIAADLLFAALSVAILAPLVGGLLAGAIRLSGQPALTDFDIAAYLLSPVGFIALVIVASVAMTATVLGVSFMMAIAERAHATGRAAFLDGPRIVLPDLPRILLFAGHLFVRVTLLVAPFALAGLLVASRYLTEFDINYYLTFRPPDFWTAVVLIGAILLAMAVVALPVLGGWSIALPLILFEAVGVRESFRESRQRLTVNRWHVIVLLAVWFAASALLSGVLLGVVGGAASLSIGLVGVNLKAMAAVLMVFVALYALASVLVTALTTGALAVLLCDLAGWPSHDPRDLPGRIRFSPALAAAAVAGILVVGAVSAFGVSQAEELRPEGQQVVVIAHRGAAGARPENTLAAMRKAIEDQADFMELDVQESADGDVIVVHDSDFMKLAGVDIKVWDATAEDLSGIDIGSWFDPAYADERTPLLREVLDLPAGDTKTLIELKYYGHDVRLEERVAEVVEAAGAEDRVALMSLKYDGVRKMKALRPEWTVGLLAATSIGRLWELEADFLAVNAAMATPALIKSSHEAGKDVYVWTVNEPLSMSRMVSLGVDGLITDEPALAREVLAQRQELGGLEKLVLGLSDAIGIDLDEGSGRDDSP